jgi:hypothetical protein
MMPRGGWLLLSMLLAACGGPSRVVRLDTGEGAPVVHVPRAVDAEPVELDEEDFKQGLSEVARGVRPPARPREAARKLLEVRGLGGVYVYASRSGFQADGVPEAPEVELTRAYLRWCERTGRKGDCLGLLVERPSVTGDARFTLALALAQGVVLEEMLEAFKGMADPKAMLAATLWLMTTYAILWTVPEPFTKGVATAMTLGLIGYVGVDTLWKLIEGFRRLMEESERAASFDELRESGERFGRVMGRNAARAFAMLAAAVVGGTAAELASKLPTLPGAVRAAVNVEAQAGVVPEAVVQVETVAITAAGELTLRLAPGAMAMASKVAGAQASGFRAWKSFSGFKKAMGKAGPGRQWHHIVEQTPGNVQRFGPEALHNTRNVIPLNEALHRRVSAFYSSIQQEITGSRTLTVRQWLSTKPYEAQRDFGLQAIDKVQKGIWGTR